MIEDTTNRILKYARGTVWLFDMNLANPKNASGILTKVRPVVIVSSDSRGSSQIVEVCGITSSDKSARCPDINVCIRNQYGEINYIECNQHFTVNVVDLGRFIGVVPKDIMDKVDDGLLVAQGMSQLVNYKSKIAHMQMIIDNQKENSIDNNDANEKLRKCLIDMSVELNEFITRNTQRLKNIECKSEPATPEVSECNEAVSEPIVVDEPVKPKRKYRRWTTDEAKEFLEDCNCMPKSEILTKYGLRCDLDIDKKIWYLKKVVSKNDSISKM